MAVISTLGLVVAPPPSYTPATQAYRRDRIGLISEYFRQGFSNKEILGMLLKIHAISLSLSHLKRILRKAGLRRRIPLTEPDFQRIIDAIQQELKGSGKCLGFKSLWRRLKTSGIPCSRNAVRLALKILDPEGVQQRNGKGYGEGIISTLDRISAGTWTVTINLSHLASPFMAR